MINSAGKLEMDAIMLICTSGGCRGMYSTILAGF